MKTFLLSILTIVSISALAQSTIVSQDFSSSNVVSDYVSGTPNSGQFNELSTRTSGLLPEPNNENVLTGRIANASIQISGGRTQMELTSAWCIYQASGGYYSLNAESAAGTIRRTLDGATAFTVEFDFSKSRSLSQYANIFTSGLYVGPFSISLAPAGNSFSANGSSFSGEQKIFVACNYTASSVPYSHLGTKIAEPYTAYLFVGETLIESRELNPDFVPSQISIGASSDSYYFTREPYYSPGNPTMGTYTLTFDNINIKNISPFTNSTTPADYAYTSGTLYATSILNQRNVYTKEVDSPTVPGQKETIKIYFDGTQWVWELAPSVSSGRTMATVLATNTSQSIPNAPCSGWTNGFGLEGGGCNSSPLPVTLTKFTASPSENNSTQLQWTTTAEINSDHFAIEHSANAKQWRKIGEVAAKGESSELANYNYTHTTPNAEKNYYRLKLTDLDGAFAYSRIVSVNFENIASSPLLYPNPVSDRLFIKDFPNAVKVEIINLSGQTVLNTTHKLEEGIPLNKVNNGMYLVKVLDTNGKSETQKIVVQK
jgi:hypothetical protein